MATFSLVTTLLFEFLTNVQSCLIHVHGFLIGNLYQWQRTCLTFQICSRTVFVLFQFSTVVNTREEDKKQTNEHARMKENLLL